MTTLNELLVRGTMPQVGDEVVIENGRGHDAFNVIATIVSVSATGRKIVTEHGPMSTRREWINGKEQGGSVYASDWLNFDVQEHKKRRKQKRKNIEITRNLNEIVATLPKAFSPQVIYTKDYLRQVADQFSTAAREVQALVARDDD